MPVQILVRKLTRAQVDKAITDSKAKITVQDHNGTMLLVVTNQAEGGDSTANAVLQKIADADAAIMEQERIAADAADTAAKAAPGKTPSP